MQDLEKFNQTNVRAIHKIVSDRDPKNKESKVNDLDCKQLKNDMKNEG